MYRTFVRRPNLESSEYEILPKEMILQETPVQKLRRLMYEVKELGQEAELNEQVQDFFLSFDNSRYSALVPWMAESEKWKPHVKDENFGSMVVRFWEMRYHVSCDSPTSFVVFSPRFKTTTQQKHQPKRIWKPNTLARNSIGRRRDFTQGFAFACQVIGARLVWDWTDFGRRLQRRRSLERGIDQADGYWKASPPAAAGYEALSCYFTWCRSAGCLSSQGTRWAWRWQGMPHFMHVFFQLVY